MTNAESLETLPRAYPRAWFTLEDMSWWSRRRPGLDMADLRHADLSNLDLRGVTLADSDARSADFSSSDLTGADLRGTDLTGADLTAVTVVGALYDARTRWPGGVPLPGAVLDEDPEAGTDPDSPHMDRV